MDLATPRVCLCEACERDPRNTESREVGVRNVLACNNSSDDDSSVSVLSCTNDMLARCDTLLEE